MYRAHDTGVVTTRVCAYVHETGSHLWCVCVCAPDSDTDVLGVYIGMSWAFLSLGCAFECAQEGVLSFGV